MVTTSPYIDPSMQQPMQQQGLGGFSGLLEKLRGGLGSVRNGLFPTDPNSGVDPEFAKRQQRAAMIRLAAGIAGGRGLGQGIAQGLDAGTGMYQSAMEKAYNNALKKKQTEAQQKAFENQLAHQAQAQSNWESEQAARADERAARAEDAKASREALAQWRKDQNEAKAAGLTKPKEPPSGYRFAADGSLDFIPGGPADPARKNDTLRPVPSAAAKGIIENRQQLSKIDRALKALDENPDAFGMQNYMPDALTQRLPGKGLKGGIDPRAQVADIGSLLIHDRSGAAVTVSEFPRLKPFIPQATDDPNTVKVKLQNLRANVAAMQEDTESIYSPEAGYKPVGGGTTAPTGPKKIASQAEYDAIPSGQTYIAPDGSTRTKK